MPLLFVVQTAAERQEFLEEFLNIPATRVVGLDQLLKLA